MYPSKSPSSWNLFVQDKMKEKTIKALPGKERFTKLSKMYQTLGKAQKTQLDDVAKTLKKPKRGANSFALFTKEKLKPGTWDQNKEQLKTKISSEWNKMTDDKKDMYMKKAKNAWKIQDRKLTSWKRKIDARKA